MNVFHPHLKKVFINHKEVDFTVFDLIPQRKRMQNLDGDITWAELKRAVANLKTHKAPGLNEVPPEAFKSMDDNYLAQVLKYLNEFCNQESDFESWHISQCVTVPKSGDLSDPNRDGS